MCAKQQSTNEHQTVSQNLFYHFKLVVYLRMSVFQHNVQTISSCSVTKYIFRSVLWKRIEVFQKSVFAILGSDFYCAVLVEITLQVETQSQTSGKAL